MSIRKYHDIPVYPYILYKYIIIHYSFTSICIHNIYDISIVYIHVISLQENPWFDGKERYGQIGWKVSQAAALQFSLCEVVKFLDTHNTAHNGQRNIDVTGRRRGVRMTGKFVNLDVS